jgi:hypothetical protein
MNAQAISPKRMATNFYYAWKKHPQREKFKTGVSLHGHTWHSKENLGFLPDFAEKVTPFARMLARAEKDHKKKWGTPIDWHRAYWTSPVSPEAAFTLEEKQVERLALAPLIALSDHDEIAANHMLAQMYAKKDIPLSLEWTVPYKGMVFHVGVHNLPPAQSAAILEELRAWTAAPDEKALGDIFARLHNIPEVLLVLNHPFTDQGRIGHEIPEPLVKEFLGHYGRWIHAVEANALQSWETNRRVILLGEKNGLPVISGGDRHGFEPSGMINITSAPTFSAFVHEIRDKKRATYFLCRRAAIRFLCAT